MLNKELIQQFLDSDRPVSTLFTEQNPDTVNDIFYECLLEDAESYINTHLMYNVEPSKLAHEAYMELFYKL